MKHDLLSIVLYYFSSECSENDEINGRQVYECLHLNSFKTILTEPLLDWDRTMRGQNSNGLLRKKISKLNTLELGLRQDKAVVKSGNQSYKVPVSVPK